MKLNHICPWWFLSGIRVFSGIFCNRNPLHQHQYHNIAWQNSSTFSIPIPINSQRVTATGPGSLYFAFRREEKTSDLVSQKFDELTTIGWTQIAAKDHILSRTLVTVVKITTSRPNLELWKSPPQTLRYSKITLVCTRVNFRFVGRNLDRKYCLCWGFPKKFWEK